MDLQIVIILGLILLILMFIMHLRDCECVKSRNNAQYKNLEGFDGMPEALQNLASMYANKKLVIDNLVVSGQIKVGTDDKPAVLLDGSNGAITTTGTATIQDAKINNNITVTNRTDTRILGLANKWQFADTANDTYLRMQQFGTQVDPNNPNTKHVIWGDFAPYHLYAGGNLHVSGDLNAVGNKGNVVQKNTSYGIIAGSGFTSLNDKAIGINGNMPYDRGVISTNPSIKATFRLV